MGGKNRWAAVAMCTALFSQSAQAAESVYLGDCARARTIQQEMTIDRLIVFNTYEGVQRHYTASTASNGCKTEQLSLYKLVRSSNNYNSLVFNIQRTDINVAKVEGCMQPFPLTGKISGTVTFSTKIDQKGELCDLYIWSSWTQKLSSDANWKGDFSNRIGKISNEGFAIAQSAASAEKYFTPIAFAGFNN